LPDAEDCGISVICTEVAFEVVQARVAVRPDSIDCGERFRFTVGCGVDEPECPEAPPPPPPPQAATRTRHAHNKQKTNETNVFFISSLPSLMNQYSLRLHAFCRLKSQAIIKKEEHFLINALYERTKALQASIIDRPF
jgi:hypothetical protein